ncbi:MAG: chromosome segregation protein SMC [Anaerolineae bacterium]|nr:chromosome segregation protein SMC [Thermoflexales bacterium]MDW8394704.1 chromosome segregation protein SMC [Anaerolineae bacterium]
MRLKSLTLNGYKTFASRTHFEFGQGITCIIGPNGSGKSNIADGIRWALGEQQYSLLRGKKTEDMIFSGSAKRPRASMAEVLLTLDNSDGFFPTSFAEIEIGRRAYRDGSNEYVLNGNRVRLRDVTDLLGHSGLAERTYTVIGQGLVDSALAQRPEERRALFEEAAGVTAYRSRREEALRKLEEVRQNLGRARDILSEIEPRLKQLERQAERARQYRALNDELQRLTRLWLGAHYRAAKAALQTALEAQAQARAALAEAHTALAELESEAAQVAAKRTALQVALNEAKTRYDEARRAHADTARALAIATERARASDIQHQAAQREVEASQSEVAEAMQRLAEAQAALDAAQEAYAASQQALLQAQAQAAERQAERAELERAQRAARQQLNDANAAVNYAHSQLAALRAQREALRQRAESLQHRLSETSAQRQSALASLQNLRRAAEQESAQASLFDAQLQEAQAKMDSAREALTQAQTAYAAAEAEARLTLQMAKLAEAGAMRAGALALEAERAGFEGSQGVLAKLLRYAPEDQRAVEAALGTWLGALVLHLPQATDPMLVLDRLQAWLARRKEGRLGVILLNHAHAAAAEQDRAALRRALAQRAGVTPLLERIRAPSWLHPVLDQLLGRTFLCATLAQAQVARAALPENAVCITRNGEVVFAEALLSLTAGSTVPETQPETAQMLDLDPGQARMRLEQARQRRDEAQRAFEAAQRTWETAVRTREALNRETMSRRRRLDEAERAVQRLEDVRSMLEADLAQVDQQFQEVAAQLSAAEAELAQRVAAQAAAQRALHEADARLETQLASGWLQALNEARESATAAANALRSAELVLQERQNALHAAQARQQIRAQALVNSMSQRAAAEAELLQAVQLAERAEQTLREAETALVPLQTELTELDQRRDALESRRQQLERVIRERESALNAATLEVVRRQDDLSALRQRADAALAEYSLAKELPAEADPVMHFLEQTPLPESVPEDLEARIAQVREHIRRLGAINFEAQSEYEALHERHRFLREQCDDLERASAALQQVIAELNAQMQVAFRQTFEAVAEAFQKTFKALFGGGQARLSLTSPDDLDACGVEIHAQPPGKRPQSLALLSGGERSLTAVALLFAILQVKPTPFCVLDEVDAALDESNVGRFRAMLEGLSDRTQFIVITHNRHTVEAASTIYGISMGTDGASTALSLRLDEVAVRV